MTCAPSRLAGMGAIALGPRPRGKLYRHGPVTEDPIALALWRVWVVGLG